MRLRRRREQPPIVGDALELMRTAVGEADPRPGDEILHGARDEHLARAGQGSDARGDMDGDPADVLAEQLDLTAVQADANLQTERAGSLGDRAPAADRTGRT